MKRDSLIGRLEGGWKGFQRTFEDLPDGVLLEPGVVEKWSIRDVLGHVTTWEEEALKALPTILQNKPLWRYSTTYGGIDAFNAMAQERKRNYSLEQVFQELADTHRRLLAFIEGVPDSAFATENRFLRRLRADTYSHYREHADHIQAWRRVRGA